MNINNNVDIQSRILASRAGLAGMGTIGQTPGVTTGGSQVREGQQIHGKTFADLLKEKSVEVKFSAHATARLQSRGIEITPEIKGKLESAVAEAENKGARDSLVLVKDLAFIVNIPNKTVITAMDGDSIKNNVFTNIDSTVIAS